jgi:hypothetical protein
MFVAACSFDGNAQPPGDSVDAPGSSTIDSPPGTIDALPSIDATPPVDAAPAVNCPANYDFSRDTSRYRFPPSKAVWAAAEADCEDDTEGWSHLIAIDSDSEWDWVSVTTGLLPGSEWYAIGVVRDEESPAGPWRSVTGGNAPVVHWRQTLGPDEPTNTAPGEPVVVLDSTLNLSHSPALGGFIDVAVDVPYFYVCECDGRPAVNATY